VVLDRHIDRSRLIAQEGIASAASERPSEAVPTHRAEPPFIENTISYAPRGIVGIDIAGPRTDGAGPYPYRDLSPLVRQARAAGLGVTIHVGEEGGEYGIAEIGEVVSTLRPDRIGHGILAAQDEKLMTQICEAKIVLEICPTSNLLTKALPDEEAVRDTFRAFSEHGVPFTIATRRPRDDAHPPVR
jgi:adenosine deaminase